MGSVGGLVMAAGVARFEWPLNCKLQNQDEIVCLVVKADKRTAYDHRHATAAIRR